jgi:hypothetical protein
VPRYVLEDDFHAERIREFDTLDAALSEFRRLDALTPARLTEEIGMTPCSDHCGQRELRVFENGGKEIIRSSRRKGTGPNHPITRGKPGRNHGAA